MSGYGFKEKHVAVTLRRIAEERLRNSNVEILDNDMVVERFSYFAVPKEKITAAAYVTVSGTKKLQLGHGRCIIHRREHNPDALQFVTNNDGNASYLNLSKTFVDYSTTQVAEVRVYNHNFFEIPAYSNGEQIDPNDPILTIAQDAYGDYYIVGEQDTGILPAKLNATLTSLSTTGASATLYNRNPGGPMMALSSRNITVYEWMGNATDTITANTNIWVRRLWGYWYLAIPNCSANTSGIPAPPAPAPVAPAPIPGENYALGMRRAGTTTAQAIFDTTLGAGSGTGIPPPSGEGEGFP